MIYHPQGFLTAILQNHARKHAVPVNLLGFKYQFPDMEQPQVRVEREAYFIPLSEDEQPWSGCPVALKSWEYV